MELINIIKALSEEIRIRILNLLKDEELCVCEIEHLLDINQSNASRHLARLTNAKMIIYEKRATYVYYYINEKTLSGYPSIKQLIFSEITKIEKCKEDKRRLEKYKKSGITCEELKEGKLVFKNMKGDGI